MVSSTSITATTAAHVAGAVNVVVTNTDAQSGTLTNGYTYTATNPAPTVTSITPNTGTANGGTAVTITGTGFLAGATVSLGERGDRRDGGEQHVDHSDHGGARGRGGERGGHQHRCPKRHLEQWVHLHHQHGVGTIAFRAGELSHAADGQCSVTVAYYGWRRRRAT